MPTHLRMTEKVMQAVVRLCRIHLPSETCGFIVADREQPDLGSRVVWMQNMASNPTRRYRMDDEAVRLAYGEFDQMGEEVLAVWHSHPTSAPLMSEFDLEMAVDDSLTYLIISFETAQPKARAYQVQHFIGNTIPTSVPIQVQREASSDLSSLPPGPWALLAGNRVRIGYQRLGKKVLSTTVATVLSCDGLSVALDPDHKTAARSLPLDRIRTVHVLAEGRAATAARSQLRAYANEARVLLGGSDVVALPSLLEALHRAYPPEILITMDEPRT